MNNIKYRTIMADPPWDINQRGNYGAINHYDLMSLERIKAIPVAGLCEDNSHLYLWCPNGLLPEALEWAMGKHLIEDICWKSVSIQRQLFLRDSYPLGWQQPHAQEHPQLCQHHRQQKRSAL